VDFLNFGVELVEDGAKRARQGIVVGEQRGPVRPKDPKIELGREAQFNRKLLEVERIKGLIHRIPKTRRYTATSCGLKVAFS
jgi:hypothetical protein